MTIKSEMAAMMYLAKVKPEEYELTHTKGPGEIHIIKLNTNGWPQHVIELKENAEHVQKLIQEKNNNSERKD